MFGAQSDMTLVRKALKGKADAWETLIMRYEKRIYNFARRMTGNREDARDLMQEIFLSVYRNLERYSQEAPFPAWLFRIASHRATDFYRRRRPTEPLFREDQVPNTSEMGPDTHLARNETNRAVLELLDQLPGEQRLVVELKFFQDLTFEEMSQTLGISTNTLKSRLYGALKKLKNMPEVAHAL